MLDYLRQRLPDNLHYHGSHHTFEVMQNAIEIANAEKISPDEMVLLKVAVLFHDAGYCFTYKDHEDYSCVIAREILPKFQITKSYIDAICEMIQATKIPQLPHTILEKIIADADLMYLGTDQFEETGNTLFEELKIYGNIQTELQWYQIQKSFIEKHHFHTDYCKNTYESQKQKNLSSVIDYLNKNTPSN